MARHTRLALRFLSAVMVLGVGVSLAVAQAAPRPAAGAGQKSAKKSTPKSKPKPAAKSAPKASAQGFKPEDAVEVREGDAWSPATYLGKEGRKYQIRYEDGTEEWVTSDRVRAPGAEGSADAGDAAADGPADAKAGAKKGPKEQFAIGAKVEVQALLSWDKATVKNRDGDLYLIVIDGFEQQVFWKWMHVSSIRKPGSSKAGVTFHVRSVGVGLNGIAKSKAEARRTFAGIEEELAADATRDPDVPRSPFDPQPYDKPIADANLDKVEVIDRGEAPAKLKVFDPLPVVKSPKQSPKSIVLKGMGDWPNEQPSDLVLGRTRALVPYYSGHGGSDQRTSRIEVLDLAAGRNLGLAKADPLSKPVAISPSGTRMAGVQHGFHSGTRQRLDVHDLPATGKGSGKVAAKGAGDPKHLISFLPYAADGQSRQTDVEWATFVDDDHLLTGTWGGDVICWHAPTATARWRGLSGRPTLSPGGKQIAACVGTTLMVIEAVSGKVLCAIDGGPALSGLSFSPDGRRIVGMGNRSIGGWDLATGKVLPEVGLPANAAFGAARALDGRFVLVGGSDLFDLEKKIVVWRYSGLGGGAGGRGARAGIGGSSWAIVNTPGRDGGSVVASTTAATLPHPAALKAADAVVPGQGLLVKPGDAVSLSIGIAGTAEQQQKITAAITAQLEAQGFRVDPAAPVKLIARTETGATTEQEYERRGFGVPPGRGEREKVSVTEKITRIFFEHNGQVAWETRTSSGVPMFVQSKEGQTIGQAVQEASGFNLAFLESVRVPAFIPIPGGKAPGFGQSTWAPGAGVINDTPNPDAPAVPAAEGDGLQ